MVKTAKSSIKAIIFVIIYFFFIVFISLFKGITFHNVNLHKFYVDKIFIKLKRKIILNIDNLQIYTTKKYNKDAIKLHNFFYYVTKTLPLFKQISINNVFENNNLIINNMIINKNKLILNTPDIYASGYFKIFKKYSLSHFDIIKYKNYTFKNTDIFSYYTKKYVFANIKTLFNKKIIYISFKADDNLIYYSLNTKKLKISYNKQKVFFDDLNILGEINTLFTFYNINFNSSYIRYKNNQFDIQAKNLSGNLKNNILNTKTKITYININTIKNLKLLNLSFSYNLKTKSLTSISKQLKLKYKSYKFFADNIAFNYYLKNKNFFLHAINLKMNNNINATSSELIISKLPKLYFYLKTNKIRHKYFSLNNAKIKGDEKLILLSNIIGKLLGFDLIISSPKIDLKNHNAISKKIEFNKIKFLNNKLTFNKKPFIFSSYTNSLLDDKIISILKKFNINLSFIQLTGENHLNFKIMFENKIDNIIYELNSSNSVFTYKNELNSSFSKLNIYGDLNKAKIYLKNFNIPYKYFETNLDSNITLNLKNKYINAFSFIKKLNVDHYLNIKNFDEKIVMDLKKNFIFLLNSSIFINLNNKTIYLYSLKNLLKFSIFNEIFKSGKIIIKLLDKETDIYANAKIKYPLILNQKNPYEINASFVIKNNNIYINNENFNTEIINFQKIISRLYDIDIDVQGLLNIINTTEKIIKKTTLSKNNEKKDKNFKAKIIAKNTNFIYKKHKFLTEKAKFCFDKEINFSATYHKSHLTGYTKNDFLLIEGKNYNKKVLVPILDFFNHFNYINLDFVLVRSPENFYTGKIYIKKGSIKDLAALNNIIAFINTIPSLLTLNTPGFSAKGYKIKKGFINYLFYNNILYFKQIKIKGVNIDLDGKGYVDLNKNSIKMKIHTVIKIKLKKIPIIGKGLSYLFFGKDGYLHINIFVKGDLNNPHISKDMGGGIIESPLKLFKRILTLPFNIF